MTTRKTQLFFFSVLLFAGCNQRSAKPLTGDTATVPATGVLQAKETSSSVIPYSNAYTQNITQTFVVKQKSVAVVKGKKGLKVRIDPGVLEKADGTAVDGDVLVKIVELTTADELFRANAATVSNGELLLSGGSYYVGMECNGQDLKIKEGRQLQMEFPRIKDNDMELFYGHRNENGDMNWVRAAEPLRIQQQYFEYAPPYPVNYATNRFYSKYKMFDSLTEKVFFMEKKMTIREMVEVLQQRGVDKHIDSMYLSWDQLYRTPYPYGDSIRPSYFVKKYRIMSCSQIQEEKDSLDKIAAVQKQRDEANRQYEEAWQKKYAANSLESQLQKYYAPAGVTQLGWINCDRFYNAPQQIDVLVEMPYTFNSTPLRYFLIYKNFNGLMSGQLTRNSKGEMILTKLPAGQPVTLVAFVSVKGQLYQCKKEFTIGRQASVAPEFTGISPAQLRNMFGANVKI